MDRNDASISTNEIPIENIPDSLEAEEIQQLYSHFKNSKQHLQVIGGGNIPELRITT